MLGVVELNIPRTDQPPIDPSPPPENPLIRFAERAAYSQMKEKETEVIKAFLSGLTTTREICKKTGTTAEFVKRIIKNGRLIAKSELINTAVVDELFGKKVPRLRKIITLNISIVEEYMTKLASNPEKIENLTPSEVEKLTNIGKNWNEMLRLDLGEPTTNVLVTHSMEATEKVLSKLKKRDPVFEYPTTIDITEESKNLSSGERSPELSRGCDDEDL